SRPCSLSALIDRLTLGIRPSCYEVPVRTRVCVGPSLRRFFEAPRALPASPRDLQCLTSVVLSQRWASEVGPNARAGMTFEGNDGPTPGHQGFCEQVPTLSLAGSRAVPARAGAVAYLRAALPADDSRRARERRLGDDRANPAADSRKALG